MAEYRSIKVEKGSGGFGGPLIITPTEKRNKVMFITGGGAEPECLAKIIELTGLIPVNGFQTNCPEDETTIHVRRFMMRIAEKLAVKNDCGFLITGENLGQVASQTAEALVVTNQAVSLPVLRPLIAMDKVDIMDKAKDIGTYETSIQPFEDCCTVFLPKHPVTKPKLDRILRSESALDFEKLVEDAVDSEEVIEIYPAGSGE